MTHPLEAFLIELPAGTDPTAIKDLEQQLAQIAGVEQCRQSTARSLDPASITMYVTLVSTVITAIGAAVPVVKQVIDLFKSEGIKGTKLMLSDGRVFQADDISVDDLLKLSNSLS
jgi:hypothetical protein